MPNLDPVTKAQLDQEIIKPKWYAFLDILGDPIRATTAGANVAFSGTGDTDLDGKTFLAYDPRFVNVSEVNEEETGSGTVTASISGLILPDNALLNIIADPINWQGRSARFWMTVHSAAGAQQGPIVPYYGGFMVSLEISGTPELQTIDVIIENWLASISRASNRTYLDQKKYDPLDDSAAIAIAIANGVGDNKGSNSGGSGGGWGPGGSPVIERHTSV